MAPRKLYEFDKRADLDRRKQSRLEKDIDDFRIFAEVFDTQTLLTLYHLLNSGRLVVVHGCIKMGKEACIHLAETKSGVVILKIYRVATSDFRNMWQYLKGDPRFRKLGGNRREVICTWASREYKNLLSAYDAGCRVPRPMIQEKNIIAMQCIRRKGLPAPRLVDTDCEDAEGVFRAITESYKVLYQGAGLIHGDLSAYNVLVGDKGPVLIDLSQGTVKDSPRATNLLFRDMETLLAYFRKLGVEADVHAVAEEVTGVEGIEPDETIII